MSNHFHVLLEVKPRPEGMEFSDEWVIQQARAVYSRQAVHVLEQTLKSWRKQGNDKAANALKERYLGRMWDVSRFMKELKQRFSLWYNKRVGRKGTLWEERFSSVLVEGEAMSLAVMSAYIDLNPVRAGMVKDPKDYRWSGYAECVAGQRPALKGLGLVMGMVCQKTSPSASEMLEGYRLWLYGQGEERRDMDGGKVIKPGLKRKDVQQIHGKKGKLSQSEMLRCRVRYFTQGTVLGSRSFVDGFFRQHRDRFGVHRQDGARPMKGADFGGLCSLRDLGAPVGAAED